MQNDDKSYAVDERCTPGRGEGCYTFSFLAKKKGGFGKLRAAVSAAKVGLAAIRGGDVGEAVGGAAQEAVGEAAKLGEEKYQASLVPIHSEMLGHEISPILRRWAMTIPEGFIETIGSTLALPDDKSWISAQIKPGKEIRLRIDFAKVKGEAQ
ncbi:MAG: hypothetical protein ACFFBS_07985 [Promethearchaeota archaeon]